MQRYTRCNPRALMLSRDKVLTKQVLTWDRIATPSFHLFPYGTRFKEPKKGKLEFPLFVKSAASVGIDYDKLIGRIVSLGLSYEPEWRLYE